MSREMRRKGQQVSEKEAVAVLEKGTSGVLSLWGHDGYPYGVPISYVYEDNRLFFHSAKQGHKIDAIGQSAKASFCVIDQDRIVPEEYTTYFRSVIVFGTIRILLMRDFEITEVKRVGTTKDFTTNKIAKRYTIMVKGKETSLYEDSGRWFVLMRT